MTFPDYSDAVDVAQLQAAVAEMISQRTKGGADSATISAGQSSADKAISFPTPFASTPFASATARTTADYAATVISRSASSVTVRVHRPTGAATTVAATVPFDWIATDLPNA